MKKLINLLFTFLLICVSVLAQKTDKNDPFVGDWKAKTGEKYAQVFISNEGTYKVNIVADLNSRESPLNSLSANKPLDNSLTLVGEGCTGKIENGKLTINKGSETYIMEHFERTAPTINAKAPKGAIVLFEGKNLDSFTKVLEKDWLTGGTPADNWKILPEGILEVVPHPAGSYESIITKQKFGDLKLHIEFRLLGEATNGGVYFMSRYEMNIKDGYGSGPIAFGNISESKPNVLIPSVNPAFPPFQWQTFDIDFRAPRFDATGTNKTENAKITVVHNGVTIYDNIELISVKGSTAKLGEAAVGPIYLQEHGVAYQFRNIWVIDKTLRGTENFKTKDNETIIESTSDTEKTSTGKKGGNKSGGKKGGGKSKDVSFVDDNLVQKLSGNKVDGESKKTGVAKISTESNETEKTKKGKSIDATYDQEMNPVYAETTVKITAETGTKPALASGFVHPGVFLTKSQLDVIKTRVTKGIEPQKSAYELVLKSPFAVLNYTPNPNEVVSCGPHSNPDLGCKDEQGDTDAAYTQALLWVATGNKTYAENAIKIMNAWSYTFKGGHNYANGPVQAAWCGSVWPRAAEIIRYTNAGWSDIDILQFQNMLRTQYLPSLIHGNCENGNKELAMCEALINIGVFCDDRAVFDLGVKMWRGRAPAYIYLKSDGPAPIEPPGCGAAIWGNKGLFPEFVDGLLQETARDSHHPTMAFASMSNAAETAYIQGVDLYKEQGKRMMAAIEFEAQYVKPNNVPAPANLTFALNSTWEVAYNHFHNRMGFNLPKMAAALPLARPSDGNHHVIWETLTHAEIGNEGISQAK